MSRAEQVASIVDRRSSHLPQRMAAVERGLQERALALRHLKFRQETLLEDTADPDLLKNLKEIDFDEIQERLQSELITLSKLRGRFSRGTLNIGVIGRTGGGKSTLLKSLSGLEKEFPTDEGSACTSVRSIVTNGEGVVKPKVVFHSERSFLQEVIHAY
jgi:ABC-type multidrug transport system ATPase subunit